MSLQVGDWVRIIDREGRWAVEGKIDALGINDAAGQVYIWPGAGWTTVDPELVKVRPLGHGRVGMESRLRGDA